MADEKITTETASAVVPPAARAKPPVDPAEFEQPAAAAKVEPSVPPEAGGEEEPLTLDQQQMAARGRQAAQFRTKPRGGRPGRPRAPRAGGYVLGKDGWVPDKKATKPKPGEPQVTFRKGEGSAVQNAGGWQVGGKKGGGNG
jgi:hypothetical protein